MPCSSAAPTNCPDGLARQTIAESINPAGEIVRAFIDGVGVQQGPAESRSIHDNRVPVQLVGANPSLSTNVTGINPAGDIVGSFVAPVNTSVPPQDPAWTAPGTGPPACIKGFLYRLGRFHILLLPGYRCSHSGSHFTAWRHRWLLVLFRFLGMSMDVPCGAALVG